MTPATEVSDDQRLQGGDLNPWTLRFSGAALEAEFEAHRATRSGRLVRLWAIGGLLVYAAAGLVEAGVPSQRLELALALRYVLALPVFAFAFLRLDEPSRPVVGQVVRAAALLLGHAVNAAMLLLTPPGEHQFYIYMTLVIVMYTHGINWLRFTYAAVTSLTGILLVAAAMLQLGDRHAADLLLLVTVALIAAFGSYQQEIFIRRDFRANCLLALQSREAGRLAKDARSAGEMKSRFMAMMGHELRTPLTAVIGFAEIILQEMLGPIRPEKYREYLQDILDSARRLLSVLNDILDYAHAVDGRATALSETVELCGFVDGLVASEARTAETGGQHLASRHAEARLAATVDPDKLRRALSHLLSNALKFTPAGGRITIATRRDADGAPIVEVADSGTGMTAAQVETALTPFGQVDGALSRRYEGAGLGLPVAVELLRLQGGSLRIESRPGHGTTVTVRLAPAAA